MSKICDIIKLYPQILINVKVQNNKKNNFETDKEILKEIEKINKNIQDNGRLIVRASGTEPLIRIMIEGKDKKEIKIQAEKLAELIKNKLN